MKRRMIFWIFFALFLHNTVDGQDNLYFNRALQDLASKMQLSGNNTGTSMKRGVGSDIEGSVYLNDNFEKGVIFTSDHERFTDVPMRFNAYHSGIEVLMPDSIVWSLANNENIVKIQLNSSVLVYTRFNSADGDKSGYLSVIYDDKSTLYRRDYKILKEGVPSNGIINEIPPRMIDAPVEYYIKINEGPVLLVKSLKDLQEKLGTHSSEIKSFIKREKTSFRTESDLIKVMSYFDSLN